MAEPKKKIPAEIIKAEKRLVKNISKWFEDLAKLLASQIEAWDLNTGITIELSFAKLVPQIINQVSNIYVRGWRKIISDLELVTGMQYVIDQAKKYVEWKKNEMLGDSTLSITKTTKDRVADIIITWLDKWSSYTELADDIRKTVKSGILSQARAQLIAVRELGNAYENGRNRTLRRHLDQTTDRAEKERATVNDDKVTEICMDNQQQWRIHFNDVFKSGDNVAPRHSNPRCRCTVNYRIL